MKELNTIVRMKFGSVLYGTNSPVSDTDIKGVFIPAAEDIILQRAPKTVQMHTGNPNSKNTSADVDYDMYSLHYYLQLLAEGQVVALDMLFAPDSMLEISTPVWDTVRRHREQLICKDTKHLSDIAGHRPQNTVSRAAGSRLSGPWSIIWRKYSTAGTDTLNASAMFTTICRPLNTSGAMSIRYQPGKSMKSAAENSRIHAASKKHGAV